MRGLLKPLIPLNACKITHFFAILQINRQLFHFFTFQHTLIFAWCVQNTLGLFQRLVILQCSFQLTSLIIVSRYDVLFQHVLYLLPVQV